MGVFRIYLEGWEKEEEAFSKIGFLTRRGVPYLVATERAASEFDIPVEGLRKAFQARKNLRHQQKIAREGPKATPPPEGFKITTPPPKPINKQGTLFDIIQTPYGTTVRPKPD